MKKNVVELDGNNYKVEYSNSSYMKLHRDYGYDFSRSDFFKLQKEDDPSFPVIFKFLLLGLVKHHNNKNLEAIIDSIDMEELMNTDKIEVFGRAFREAHPDPEEDEEDEEVKKEKGEEE